MFNDKAIEFETQKYKVKKTLTRLKEAGLNITKYELLINQIIAQCEKDTKFDETQTDLVIDSFTSNNNIAIYNKAIKALESIYIELQRYEIYLKISAFCNTLKLFLTSPSLEKLESLQTNLKSLLRNLKNSNTLNYEVEGPLVENIYHLTYEFIKVEIKLLGSSPTLNYLKNDDIHALNLDKQIAKELESLDLKSDQYLALAAKKYAIDEQGLNNNYLDEELIATLIRSLNPQDYSQLLEELSKKVGYYKTELNILAQEMERQEATEEFQKKEIKFSFGKIRKNIVLFVTSASVALGLVAGSVTLAKKIATIPTYETTTTIYDPKLEEQEEPTVEYTTTENDCTYLCEYQPYVATDYGFKREILTYDVSYLEGLTDDEYF